MFYRVYVTIGIDGIVLFGLILYILQILFPLKEGLQKWTFILSGSFVYALVYNVPHLASLLQGNSWNELQMLPFWYHFTAFIVLASVFSHFAVKGGFGPKLLYILFLVSFIQEYKLVCSPLYHLINILDRKVYEILDFCTLLLLYLLLFLLSILFRKLKITTSLKTLPNSTLLIFYYPVSFLIIYIVVFGNSALKEYFPPLISVVIMSNLPIIYYFFAKILQSYEEKKKMDIALRQTLAQVERYKFSSETQERIRKERHELRNNYFYIHALLKEKEYDKLDEYINKIIDINMESISEISTGNTLMDYILNKKIQEARKHQIKVYSEIIVPDQLAICDERFCSILLNLIDNAIEASVNEIDPDIHIHITCANNHLVCKILNKTSENILDINPELLTTKKDKDNHGMGMRIVKETVSDMNGIINYAMENDYFCVSILLPIV